MESEGGHASDDDITSSKAMNGTRGINIEPGSAPVSPSSHFCWSPIDPLVIAANDRIRG